ncbi:MAG: hypothetical protein A2144_14975 [Chloroflexi bacterium RBG_16_50_9]|nr:MAG: hypothetical protein A2144_14975 [Chloroflexi bacterium RBG_16_50_9]
MNPDLVDQEQEVNLQEEFERSAPEYISVGLAAKHCGVSNTTVLRWITCGQLPAFRLPGGHYRIERDNFSNFLASYSMPVRTHYEIIKRYSQISHQR